MSEPFANKLKSYFLTLLVSYAVVVTIIGVLQLQFAEELGIWLGVTVSAGSIAIFFARLYLVKIPRTSPGLMGFTIAIFGATMYSVYTSYQLQLPTPAPLLGMLSLVGWVTYVGWYSELGDRSKDRIKVGKKLPNISLESYDGNKVSSADWIGEKRLVLFYRGNWCPICTAQVNELTNFEKEFEELNVKIALVSPQAHEKSRRHAKKYGMKFDFLVDVNNEAAKTLGILHEGGLPKGFEVLGYDTDVPKPTLFVLDEVGKVVFADLTENYRLRPDPQDILAVLRN